jgi:uncharacterized protein YuzE
MRMTYDPAADAAYLYLAERATGRITRTEEVAAGLMLDFDQENRVVGVEILGVSKLPGAKPMQMAFEVLTSDAAAA